MGPFETELRNKIRDHTVRRFGGNYQRMFDHYAAKQSPYDAINGEELEELLQTADVGNRLTRGVIASRLLERLGQKRDGQIRFRELQNFVLFGKLAN